MRKTLILAALLALVGTPALSQSSIELVAQASSSCLLCLESDGTGWPLTSNTTLTDTGVTATFGGDVVANALKSIAGDALAVSSTAPAAANGASQAGEALTITASNAVASLDTAGAAAGGSVTITAGNAARLTSGNANGGGINLTTGGPVGTGTNGSVTIIAGVAGTNYKQAFEEIGTATALVSYDAGQRATISNFDGINLGSAKQLGWASAAAPAHNNRDTGLARSAAGVVRTTNGSTGIRGLSGGGTAVASAAALPLPTGRVFHVTGTTGITSITSTNFQSGVVITLIFDDSLTVTDGGNLKLAGDFTATADDTLTLAYDGTNWYETSRSVN